MIAYDCVMMCSPALSNKMRQKRREYEEEEEEMSRRQRGFVRRHILAFVVFKFFGERQKKQTRLGEIPWKKPVGVFLFFFYLRLFGLTSVDL